MNPPSTSRQLLLIHCLLESAEHYVSDRGMQQEENDDNGGCGSIADLSSIISDFDPPHQQR